MHREKKELEIIWTHGLQKTAWQTDVQIDKRTDVEDHQLKNVIQEEHKFSAADIRYTNDFQLKCHITLLWKAVYFVVGIQHC